MQNSITSRAVVRSDAELCDVQSMKVVMDA